MEPLRELTTIGVLGSALTSYIYIPTHKLTVSTCPIINSMWVPYWIYCLCTPSLSTAADTSPLSLIASKRFQSTYQSPCPMQQIHVPCTPFPNRDHVTSAPGGGAWGTALAIHSARMGHRTLLWARESDVVASVNGPARENSAFLPVGIGHRIRCCAVRGTVITCGVVRPCSGADT